MQPHVGLRQKTQFLFHITLRKECFVVVLFIPLQQNVMIIINTNPLTTQEESEIKLQISEDVRSRMGPVNVLLDESIWDEAGWREVDQIFNTHFYGSPYQWFE